MTCARNTTITKTDMRYLIPIVNAVVAAGVFVTVHCNVTGTVYRKQENMRHASVSQIVTANSALSCGSLCNPKDWCEVFNFHPVDKLCELVHLTPGEEYQMVTEVGWAMYYAFDCLPGWRSFGNACYYLDKTARDRDDAQANCTSRMSAAHLADIKYTEEQSFIASYVTEINTDNIYVWIGLTYNVNRTQFVWTDGDSLDGGFEAWCPGEPWTEDCAFLLPSCTYEWADGACIYLFISVCEYNIPS